MDYPVYTQKFDTCFKTTINCGLREGTADFNAVQSVAVQDEYNLKAISFEDGDVVIDIGAHIGSVSLLLASLDTRLEIYAYEPLPENVDLLRKNAVMNGFANIFPFLLAVGGKAGREKIHYGDEATESGRCHHFLGNAHGVPLKGFCEADVTTLEKIFLDNKIKKCKLVKLDAEGAELDILRACPLKVLRRIDYIVGEHHSVKREVVLKATRGLFVDVPCPWQTEVELGHFWFRRRVEADLDNNSLQAEPARSDHRLPAVPGRQDG